MKIQNIYLLISIFCFMPGCSKNNTAETKLITPDILTIRNVNLNNINIDAEPVYGVSVKPVFKIKFSNGVDKSSITNGISLVEKTGLTIPLTVSYQNQDSILECTPSANLKYLSKYTLTISTAVKSINKGILNNDYQYNFSTAIDSTDKFERISDAALLDSVQKKMFYYFWDMAHPISGLILERNSSGDIVTSGGTGFGLMTFPIAVNRSFVTRLQALTRAQKIVNFLTLNAQKFHGAFPHWMNGSTGVVIPFSANDNGADLVETSYLMAGLLTIRQYFNLATAEEVKLRSDINLLWDAVEWNWFRKSNENVLYWHWSPSNAWNMNMPIKGWNECLITYILAASSNTNPITNIVYTNGFKSNGSFVNGASYYNYSLPLGPAYGGPLFWSHYSFLGINPFGLKESNIDYETQVLNHTLINYQYVQVNPKKYYGYSDACWGLTACDVPGGYAACEPMNDKGVIAPTAALSSFPYTPENSLKALKFYYYILGDKIWKEYGFMDAFSLHDQWYSNTALAIDQGPAIIMIENYRTQLIWNLFTSCPELKRGMRQLGFTAPYL